MNALGASIYRHDQRTDGRGRTAKNVIGVQALFADTDGADIQPLLVLKPHIVVESSPGKWHIYWLVNDCELSQFKAIQSAIAEKFGTDKNVCDLPRVMRPPGFLHNKYEPFSITFAPAIMDPKREPYAVQEVVEGLNLELHNSKGRGTNATTFLGEPPGLLGKSGIWDPTFGIGESPPPSRDDACRVQHLAAGLSRNAMRMRKTPKGGWSRLGASNAAWPWEPPWQASVGPCGRKRISTSGRVTMRRGNGRLSRQWRRLGT